MDQSATSINHFHYTDTNYLLYLCSLYEFFEISRLPGTPEGPSPSPSKPITPTPSSWPAEVS